MTKRPLKSFSIYCWLWSVTVAPICYAHLAATQMSQFMKFEDHSETSSSHGGTGVTSAGAVAVPQLPKLQEAVANSMFFC